MRIPRSKLFDIIKLICTALISIAATLLVESCTTSLNIQRNTSSSTLSNRQSTTTSADSASVGVSVLPTNKPIE